MESSNSGSGLKAGRLIAEVDPPRGTDVQSFLDSVLRFKGRVDQVRVTDGEHAIMRMSPLAPCLALKDKGVEPSMMINGRDRNRISFQGDLLCASALGITDLVVKEGHDPREGDQPLVRSSGDLDLDIMVRAAAALNQGLDLAGEPLETAASFSFGIYLELSDQVAVNRERAEYLFQLRDYGVDSVTLGPTYDLNIIERFLPVAEQTGIKLYTSLLFLKSVMMIRYLNNLDGVPSIPQEFLKKMMQAKDKKRAGLEVAADFYRELSRVGDGIVLLALGSRDKLPDFLDLIER